MELGNKKIKAITLLELMICFVMAAIFMLLLFGITSKKAETMEEYEAGVFYCWKDWAGTLYQKNSSEDIQQVSECKINIPKNAKNIKVFLIGGGSGGYDYDKTKLLDIEQDYTDIEKPNTFCLKTKDSQNRLYPYTSILIESKLYKIENICDDNGNNCIYKPQLKEASFNSDNSEILTSNFFKDLYKQGKCYLPLISNGRSKYINPKKTGNHIYYNSETKAASQCFAKTKKYGVKQGNCYENIYFFVDNEEYTDINPADITNINGGKPNVLRYSQIKPQKQFEIYKSSAGKIVSGSAMAGREYTISANAIGEGGNVGKSGFATTFADLRADGGAISNEKHILTVNTNKIKYNNLEDLRKKESITVCKSENTECQGIINNSSLSGDGIKTTDEISIKVSEYNKDTKEWDKSKNPQFSTDSIKKTGFGYFGASGTAKNCLIKYYPIRRFGYNNKNDYGIINDEAEILCNPAGHGMGGAIIIKWD